MIELRPKQSTLVDAIREHYRRGLSAPLLVSPTGSGKTVIFSYLCSRLVAARKRVYILVHRDELIDQVSATLTQFGVPHGTIAAGRDHDAAQVAQVCSVFTLVRRLDRVPAPDYLIADECHHAIGASTWGKVIADFRMRNPALRILGVTATPVRLSGEGLGELFDSMIVGPDTAELLGDGTLSPYRMFAPAEPIDLSGLRVQAGEFVRSEAEARVNRPTITGNAVTHYRKLCDGHPAVAFCAGIAHMESVAEAFRSAGYRAQCIDGRMDRQDRRARVADFADGRLNVLCSVDVVSEGFDVPGIAAALLLRPTASLGLYMQQVGRALRTAPGKTSAVILDHAGNSTRHGMPDDPRDWTLDARRKAKREAKDKGPMIRQCKQCYAIARASADKCPECGAAFVIIARKINEQEGELREVANAARRTYDAARRGARTLEDLVRYGRAKGYNPGWAEHVWRARTHS